MQSIDSFVDACTGKSTTFVRSLFILMKFFRKVAVWRYTSARLTIEEEHPATLKALRCLLKGELVQFDRHWVDFTLLNETRRNLDCSCRIKRDTIEDKLLHYISDMFEISVANLLFRNRKTNVATTISVSYEFLQKSNQFSKYFAYSCRGSEFLSWKARAKLIQSSKQPVPYIPTDR